MSGLSTVATAQRPTAVPHADRPKVSTVQQWWVLTVRMITPTLRNGELATQGFRTLERRVGKLIHT